MVATVYVLWLVISGLTQGSTPSTLPTDDGFSPAAFVIVLIFLAVCLVLLGVGVLLASVGTACVAVLVALGIVTSSAVTALLRQRISAGVRAFHYQICAAVAVTAGVVLLWAASALFDLRMRLPSILAIGATAGVVTGLSLAGASDWAAQAACRRLMLARGRENNDAPAALRTKL